MSTVTLPAFQITGISTRTINNGSAGKDIKALWDRFFGEDLLNRIPGKLSTDIYCVYTNYESDHTGYYDCLLGCKTENGKSAPEGFTMLSISAADYQIFESQGPLPHTVLDTWQQIWESDIVRKYTADFDVYPISAFGAEEPTILTYLSV